MIVTQRRYDFSKVSTVAIALLTLSTGSVAQRRPLTVEEVTRIFNSGGDRIGWDEFDVPEFVAAAYGPRARSALLTILEEPSTQENYYLQLEALTAAQYPRIGVPLGPVLEYANGTRGERLPPELRGIVRQRAIKALSTHPDRSLVPFWMELLEDPNPMFRQFVPFGLSCAVGEEAMGELARLVTSSDSVLARLADRAKRELAGRGPDAMVCGTAARLTALDHPRVMRPALREAGQHILREIP